MIIHFKFNFKEMHLEKQKSVKNNSTLSDFINNFDN